MPCMPSHEADRAPISELHTLSAVSADVSGNAIIGCLYLSKACSQGCTCLALYLAWSWFHVLALCGSSIVAQRLI